MGFSAEAQEKFDSEARGAEERRGDERGDRTSLKGVKPCLSQLQADGRRVIIFLTTHAQIDRKVNRRRLACSEVKLFPSPIS